MGHGASAARRQPERRCRSVIAHLQSRLACQELARESHALLATAGPTMRAARSGAIWPTIRMRNTSKRELDAYSNLGRNTLQTPNTNNIDLAVYKDLNFGERMKFRLGAQFGNIINHPQYIPGSNPGLWSWGQRCERLQLRWYRIRFVRQSRQRKLQHSEDCIRQQRSDHGHRCQVHLLTLLFR